MKIWTRITLVTSAVVAVALGIYAALDLDRSKVERRRLLEGEAAEVARVLRDALESDKEELSTERANRIAKGLRRPDTQLRITVLSRDALTQSPGQYTPDELSRLKNIVELRPTQLRTVGERKLIYSLPIRAPDTSVDDGYQVLGIVEVERPLKELEDGERSDLLRIIPVFAVILGLMITAIVVFTRRLVTHPIDKLISGIDDVASGDLSRVLLSEREDEIGALASRFNEMTASLRESREETKRQNDARHNLEEQLSETEKLATIGQLAAEIAHEVGTPLNVIAGRARSMGKKAHDAEAVTKNSTIIAEQAARITKIIQRLLDFARRKVGTVERARVNLNQVTLTTMDFLESKFKGAKVRSSLNREEGLPPVKGHADRLQQVLINLLLNAVEAVGEGGRVRVETYSETRRRPGLELEPEQTYVVVTISDSGPGIPEEDRDKIFEPFYTSKDGQGGTGLGLAVSSGIIKEHDGWIEVGESDDHGSRFQLFLPAMQDSSDMGATS